MRVHFIAIGGSAMHNLAIALHKKGFDVSGSDDEIFEPSRSRLDAHGLLPEPMGWDASRISSDLDAIILGMHARKDNPEMLRAQELGLHIFSYPEYLYEQSRDKTRVVIGGSHGKTSITAMILHVLRFLEKDFDYMVGAQLEGFDTMVQLTAEAPVIILEGDEYLSSPIDLRPKFHHYYPHIALISGIAWDHINVFPTYENYVEQFDLFVERIVDGGALVYCEADPEVKKVAEASDRALDFEPYQTPEHSIENGVTSLHTAQGGIPLQIFGVHNLQNLEGARLVLEKIGVETADFYRAIQSFSGAAKRLEKVAENSESVVYKDFAHSPSKLKATTAAVQTQFPDRELVACMELHTFSSLNSDFLKEYKGSMNTADRAIVYYNEHTIAHKKLAPISPEQVKEAFGNPHLEVYTDADQLFEMLRKIKWSSRNLLLMSSGNFDGVDINAFGEALLAGANE